MINFTGVQTTQFDPLKKKAASTALPAPPAATPSPASGGLSAVQQAMQRLAPVAAQTAAPVRPATNIPSPDPVPVMPRPGGNIPSPDPVPVMPRPVPYGSGAALAPSVSRFYEALLGRNMREDDARAIGGGPGWEERVYDTGTYKLSFDNALRTITSSPEFRGRFTVPNADPMTQASAWVKGYIGRDLTPQDVAALTPIYQSGGMPAVLDAILASDEMQARLRALLNQELQASGSR